MDRCRAGLEVGNLRQRAEEINFGWSYEQVQRDYGLTDAQIEKMKTENMEREHSKVENAAKFFDAGNSLVE